MQINYQVNKEIQLETDLNLNDTCYFCKMNNEVLVGPHVQPSGAYRFVHGVPINLPPLTVHLYMLVGE